MEWVNLATFCKFKLGELSIWAHGKADKEVNEELNDSEAGGFALAGVVVQHRRNQLKHPRNTWLFVIGGHNKNSNTTHTLKFTKDDKYSENNSSVVCGNAKLFLKAFLFLPEDFFVFIFNLLYFFVFWGFFVLN